MVPAPWSRAARKASWVAVVICLSATACSSTNNSKTSATDGKIHGTVTVAAGSSGKSKANVTGARVMLTDNAKTVTMKVEQSGKFKGTVPAGTYKVKVSGAGKCKTKTVKVTTGKTTKLKIDCKLSS